MAQENSKVNSGSWSGVIINSGRTVDEALAEAPKFTDKVPGTRLVLYDDTIRQIYDLDPQTQAGGQLGRASRSPALCEATLSALPPLKLSPRLGSPLALLSLEVKEKVKRTVAVLKARGTNQDLGVHELEINSKGVAVK